MFTKINDGFWFDEEVLNLSPNAKLLLIYLMTNRHRNMAGLYRLPKIYVADDLQLPEQVAAAAWGELLNAEMISYDEQKRLVLVRDFMKHNPLDSPKQVTGAIKKIIELPKSPLMLELVEILKRQNSKGHLEPLLEELNAAVID